MEWKTVRTEEKNIVVKEAHTSDSPSKNKQLHTNPVQDMWVVWNETDTLFAVTENERKPLFLLMYL